MLKHLLLGFCFFLPGLTVLYAQTWQVKQPFSIKEKMEVLAETSELFSISATITYQLSTQDPIADFSKMPDPEKYDISYLHKHKKAWEADSVNPVHSMNLGNYYNFQGEFDSAGLFFRKALDKLDIKYFDNDSAFYLSVRGNLKLNLGMEDPLTDFERAIHINSGDSIARAMLPLLLINNREFKRAADACVLMLDNPSADPVFPYVMLISSELSAAITNKMQTDEKTKIIYRNTDYNKLVDLSLVDKYAARFNNNIAIRNARYMADLFSLTLKMAFFDNIDNPDSLFAYTVNDRNRLVALEKIFTSAGMRKELNPYSRNKSLGFIYFLQQQKDKAVSSFKEAIKVFPPAKISQFLSPAEIYDALSSMYLLYKDTSGFTTTILDKIKAEPAGKKEAGDYFLLANLYFNTGDLKKAEEWATKGFEANAWHFDNLRLLAHLNFLNGKSDRTEAYANQAVKLVQTTEQQINILLQFAIYQLFNGDANSAYGNMEIVKKTMGEQPCELCERLEKYIEKVK